MSYAKIFISVITMTTIKYEHLFGTSLNCTIHSNTCYNVILHHHLLDHSSFFGLPFVWCVFLLCFIFLDAYLSDSLVVMGHCKTIFGGLNTPNTTVWHITPFTHEPGGIVPCESTITVSLKVVPLYFHHCMFHTIIFSCARFSNFCPTNNPTSLLLISTMFNGLCFLFMASFYMTNVFNVPTSRK